VVISAIPNQTVSANVAMSYAFPSTTFDDANTGQALTYSATGMPAWMTFTPGSRLFTGTPPSAGSWTLTVTATDPLGAAVSTQFTITSVVNNAPVVANAVPDQNAIRQQAFTYTFPANTFSDPNGDTLTYSYSKIVGTAAWLNFDAVTRTFSGTPASIANDVTIRLTATDTGGLSVYDDFIIHVTAAGGGGNQAPVVATPVPDQNAVRQQAFTYTFPANTFSDPNGDTLTYSYTKVVGTAAWLSFNAATRTFSGTPANIANDVTIRLTATDAGGLSTYDDFIIHVAAAGGGSQAMQASRTQMQSDSMASSQTTSTQTMAATNPTQPGTTPNHQVLWFTYDVENRVQVINGTMNNGVIMVGGYGSWSQQYDIVGNVTAKTTLDTSDGTTYVALSEYDLRGEVTKTYYQTAVGQPSNGVDTVSTYDAAGHLTQTTRFFGNNDMRSVWIDTIDQYDNPWSGYVPLSVGGWLYNRVTYTYDADGRLKTQQTDGRTLNWTNEFAEYGRGTPSPRVVVPTDVVAAEKDPLGALAGLSTLAYTTSSGASGYDSSGRLMTHRYLHQADGEGDLPHGAFTTTFTHTYLAKESFLETGVIADVDAANFRDGNTASTYDAWGRRTDLTETTPLKDYQTTLINKRYFSYDAEGGILTRRDGTMENGVFTQTVGGYSPNFNPAPDFITNAQWNAMTETERQSWLSKSLNQHFVYSNGQQVGQLNEAGKVDVADKLTAFDSSSTGSGLVAVNDGDTLKSIAQRVYGNSSLWYVLADANAVTDAKLFTGQMLKTPQVKTNKNDSTTFKPYNPADVIGPTEPGTPYIGAPPAAACGKGMMIVAMIAIIVACLVAPELIAVIGPALGSIGITSAAIVGGIEAGAIAAVSSAVSQGIGSLAGLCSFSWKQVAVDGVVAGVTAGFGTYLQGVSAFTKAGTATLNTMGKVVRGVAGYGTSVIANAAVGRDANFSWKAVAATAVGAYIGAKLNIGKPIGITAGTTQSGKFINEFAGNYAAGALNATVRRAVTGEKQDWREIAYDAFGNTVANEVIGAFKGYQADQAKAKWASAQDEHDAQLMAQDDPSLIASSGVGSFLDRYPAALASNDPTPDPLARNRQAMLDAGTLSNSNPDTDYSVTTGSEIMACPKEAGMGGCHIVAPLGSGLDIGMVSGHDPTIAELAEAAQTYPDNDPWFASDSQLVSQLQSGGASANLYDQFADAYNDLGDRTWNWFNQSAVGRSLQGTQVYTYMEGQRSRLPHFSGQGVMNSMLPASADMTANGQRGTWAQSIGGFYVGGLNNGIGLYNSTVGQSSASKLYEMLSGNSAQINRLSVPATGKSGAALSEFGFTAASTIFGARMTPMVSAETRLASASESAYDVGRYGGEARRAILLAEVQKANTLTEKIGVVARSRLQVVTDVQNAALAANPRIAQTVLSPAEYAAASRRPWLARMQYGNAVERLVAQEVNQSSRTSTWLRHVGGPNNPDFVGSGRLSGMNFDITTEAAREAHYARPGYGYGLNVIPYERPATFSLFPQFEGF
jgi:hypothetical protein